MHKALCLFINLIKLHWWEGMWKPLLFTYLWNPPWKNSSMVTGCFLNTAKKTLTYSNVPPNSGGTFLANRLVKCPATALICTCFLVWSSSDIPRSSLMVFTASSRYRFTTHTVCTASLPMVVARNASLNAPCANLVSSISSVSGPLLTHYISATSKFSRSNTVIFVAGGLTSLPALRRSVIDTDLRKTMECNAGRFPDVFIGIGTDIATLAGAKLSSNNCCPYFGAISVDFGARKRIK